jgi:hypothetical protein
LKNTNRATISLVGGLDWLNTNYTGSVTQQGSEQIAGALVLGKVSIFRFDKTNLTVSGTAIPALNQPGRVYFATDASYFLKFLGDFTWNVTFYGNWDTRPPAHSPGSDYGVSSGLGWTFGNK